VSSKIEIEDNITVGALAEKLAIPVVTLVSELFKNGIMATVNERIDFDTAQIIVGELALDIELTRKAEESKITTREARKASSDKAVARPPVVAVMGHVDHGKTSLLDAIRGAEVVKGEAGGITQHISAYQITHNDRKITFLDTPGHEAFAALREHGAQLTDVVIIVVAADDGIKPQTIEAIRFAEKAGVKIVVAINKIDKTGADINRTKQQLSENNLMIEEWGGETVVVPVSAKTKEGITELLDMVLLVADVEELKADEDVPARGLIIEAHMEQGRGPLGVALVEAGQLKKDQFVVTGTTYGKVKSLENTSGQTIAEAGPSTPVIITGFKTLPEFGDEFQVVASEKEAKKLSSESSRAQTAETKSGINTSSELIRKINRDVKVNELPVLIKADVKGSLTSVIDSLRTLDTEEVAIRVVGSGIGAINDNDLHMAQTSGAIIYGFNVDMPQSVKQQVSRDKIPVRLYKIIYELIEDVRNELGRLLSPEIVETELGRLIVKGIFKTTKTESIVGGEVTKGKLTMPALVRITRDKEKLGEAELTALKKGPQDVKEVFEGEMCGIQLATTSKIELAEGDRLDFYTREEVTRTL
jgi:translation initiation factor IF-2